MKNIAVTLDAGTVEQLIGDSRFGLVEIDEAQRFLSKAIFDSVNFSDRHDPHAAQRNRTNTRRW